jgi:hypothetical protein
MSTPSSAPAIAGTPALTVSNIAPPYFLGVWKAALHNYKEETGCDLEIHRPLFDELRSCDSVDGLASVLKNQEMAFKAFRNDGRKARAVLAPVVRLVKLFADSGAEAAAASVGCPSMNLV